ncbi:LuxR C-terminal-related transcriptional regulator [Cupriavidus sp. 2TAF22]|uniref:LuxR C-terminal-related transcriptional regulator n=1 Tax=unclassified Cupriavidus TaxID=2640874 RepID=UPI003F90C141
MQRYHPVPPAEVAPPRLGKRLIVREALLASLHDARQRKLVLITAGAGFGKTTLMAQWRQKLIREGASVAWLSPCAGEDAPQALWAGLRAALLHAAGPGAQAACPDDAQAAPQRLAAGLVRALATAREELYVMIDEFDRVGDPASRALLQAILEARLPNLHLVIASRKAPALLLGRLRALGELGELGGADLAFSYPETLAFLKLHRDARVDLDAATRLHSLSDGWPAGLQLLSASLKQGQRHPARLRALAPHADRLHAYLLEDVLAGLPGELLAFMQSVSVLPRFNAALAAFVTGAGHAAALIEAIDAHGSFLLPAHAHTCSPTDEAGDWYRFHPMFTAFLAQRLAAGQEDVAALHRRAAAWFVRQGDFAEAVPHALLGKDFDAVAGLVERALPALPSLSQLRAFRQWIEAVPCERLAPHPRLLLLAGWASAVTARPAEAEAWMTLLEAARPGAGVSRHGRLLRGVIALQRDDMAQLEAILATLDHVPLGLAALEHIRLGLTLRCLAARGRHADVRDLLASAAASAARNGTGELALMARATTAGALLLEGYAVQAERLSTEALADAERRHGRRSVGACFCAATAAVVLYERDDTEAARLALADRLDMLKLSSPDVVLRAARCHARLEALAGLPHDAVAYLIDMEAHFRGRGIARGVAHMVSERQRIVLAGGDWRHAQSLQAALDLLAQGHAGETMIMAALARARLALAMGEAQGALLALEPARAAITGLGREAMMVTSDVLQALALDALGCHVEATACLESAVATAYRLGLVRTLLDEGERVGGLLGRLGRRGDATQQAYLARLQGLPPAMSATSATSGTSATSATGGERVGTATHAPGKTGLPGLTRREQEILGLLEQSMSNKRIALALNISELTVKWNLRQIFAKLGVSRRYDAIVAARRQGQHTGAG